ncbi:DnaJ C-terminal domain-containing protein [Quatrionicoccus australiensis]|uniref:DnaJ C-terminal domain-containing protein n=1 Tax=Quatrionicoccus australiensis TaxID=138118 RepID=UPI001CF8F0A0|nr:DnaJ C-terminal domain-containing protein [Quatrionicoccus australiensis]UCV16909.1 DnaJ domain-containing protein [Quatrionicoccus australiensis]
MKFRDYYQAMGLERTASAEAIKKAYRKLAHQYHLDVSKDPAGEEKFKALAEVYATLKDPEKRQAYDNLGSRPSGEQFTPPDWQQRNKTDAAGFDDVDLADIFAAFSRSGRQRQPAPVAGQDYEVAAHVSLEQLFRGGEIEVRAELPEYDKNGLAHRVDRTFRISIPLGAADGQRLRLAGKGLRLAGKGGSGFNGGRAGDLYVALAVQAHPLYRVSGRDLYLDLPLTPWEAVLGATVQVPTRAGWLNSRSRPARRPGKSCASPGAACVRRMAAPVRLARASRCCSNSWRRIPISIQDGIS